MKLSPIPRAIIGMLVAALVPALLCFAQTADTNQPSTIFKVGPGVSPPKAILSPDPQYTDEARKSGVEGTVVLWVVIRADGTVADVKVKKSLDESLDKKAIDAVKRWRFEPARKDGQPVAVQVNVEVNFHLYDKKGAPTTASDFPGSKIENLSDGKRVFSNSQLGVRVSLPTGWSQVSFHPATYTNPANIILNKTQTFAIVEIVRHVVEASPSLYRKMFQQGLEHASQSFDILGEENISKDDWNGVRLFVSASRRDVKQQCIVDIYSRDTEHYVLDACAPDEVFPKYRQDFDTILKSVAFTPITSQPNADSK